LQQALESPHAGGNRFCAEKKRWLRLLPRMQLQPPLGRTAPCKQAMKTAAQVAQGDLGTKEQLKHEKE
jgi:hypothetical protein